MSDSPNYPRVVHQAAEMISVQLGIEVDEAQHALEARAVLDARPLNVLATDVVAGRVRFEEG